MSKQSRSLCWLLGGVAGPSSQFLGQLWWAKTWPGDLDEWPDGVYLIHLAGGHLILLVGRALLTRLVGAYSPVC